MSLSSRTRRTTALLLSGAAIGAAGGYAVSASGAGRPAPTARTRQGSGNATTARAKGRIARLKRAVSLTAVVPGRDGKFSTISIARGTLVGVTAQQLTLREGTPRASYKTVSLTVRSNVTVRLSKQPSTLSALSPGDRVAVVQGPRKTIVVARPAGSSQSTGKVESAAPSA